jgi:simple sugar transport system ATP-binding protein
LNIDKSFGRIRALDNVMVHLYAGELHCILGENGAGKSTLMRILSGVQRPDRGEIKLRGTVQHFRNRQDGIRAGVGIVQQHHGLIEQLTGVENFILGQPHGGAFLQTRQALKALTDVAEEFGLEIRPGASVGAMANGERQRLEIVIALAAGSDLLILDEPTSALPTRDVDILIDVLKTFRQKGKAIAYITHKLREVTALADRVTVLRRGQVLASLFGEEIVQERLTAAMMGDLAPAEAAGRLEPGTVVAKLARIVTAPSRSGHPLHEVSLEVREREVLGVAGMIGSGQDDLARVLAGLTMPLRGRVEPVPSVVAYLPEDRASEGIAEQLTLLDNLIVHTHADRSLRRGILIDGTKARAFAQALVVGSDVRSSGLGMRAGLLSGGNQQKLVIARELERKPQLIVAHNPYRGLDAHAARAVRTRLVAARDQGCAIVLISPDLEDLFDLADRIIVLAEGTIAGEVDPRKVSARELGLLIGKTVEKAS